MPTPTDDLTPAQKQTLMKAATDGKPRLTPVIIPPPTEQTTGATFIRMQQWPACECGKSVWRTWNYCPYCGAKIEKENE